MRRTIRDVLQPLQEALNLDGADLEFKGEREGVAYFRLRVAGARCEECVLPREMLQQVVLASLQEEFRDLRAVDIDDPRDATASGGT